MIPETTWESIKGLWAMWATAGNVTVLDALSAVESIAVDAMDRFREHRQDLRGLRELMGDEQFANLEGKVAEHTAMAMRIGAVIGYSVARTFPTEEGGMADWPSKALAYSGLDHTLFKSEPDAEVASSVTLKVLLGRILALERKGKGLDV